MIKEIIVLASIAALAIAEAPLSGPYPPSGWKPSGAPFTLPREFLPQSQPGGAEVEFSKERVEHAGQLRETTTFQPSNSYLPPEEVEDSPEDNSTEDYLKVQGLPSSDRQPFNQQQPQSGQLNTGEYNAPAAPERSPQSPSKFGQLRQQYNKQQQFVQNRPQQFGQLNQQPQFNRQQQQFNQQPQQFNQQPQQFNQQPQQFNPQPQQFNSQPQQFNPQPQQFNSQPQQYNPQPQQFNSQPQQYNPQPQQFNPQPQQFNSQPQQFNPQQPQFTTQPQFNNQATPAQKYGPPTPNPDAEEDDATDDTTDANADSREEDQPAVAVSNSLSNGRYYILTPDNTLQRVVFMTTQDKEEVRTNGFTAQLRYMPVEPIRDPIYAYNEQGQLIRIFKK